MLSWDGMRWVVVAAVGLGSGCLLPNPKFSGDESGSGDATQGTGTTSTGGGPGGAPGTSVGAGSGSGTDSGASAGAAASDASSNESGGVTSGGTGSSGGCMEVDQYVDADGDGYGVGPAVLACPGPGLAPLDGDCDEGNASVNPGAIEVCDPGHVDEDCDGLINEASANNGLCDDCALLEYGGHAYWFCTIPMTWDAARGVCQGFGAVDLAIVGDGPENAFIYEHLPDVDLWLGARDVDPNQLLYTWVDGSPLSYTNWGGPDPNYQDGCMVMAGDDMSRWADRACDTGYFYVCESKG